MSYTITTYKELQTFYNSFFKRNLPFIILKARGGLGKSYFIEQEIKKGKVDIVLFTGKETPLNIYLTLAGKPNALIVFDDVDELLKNKVIISLMKQICLNDKERVVKYGSTFKPSKEILKKYGLQEMTNEIIINNRVMLITNKNPVGDENLKALMTRGVYVEFKPSNQEILDVMRTFAKDKELLSFISQYKDVLPINFRIYTNQLKPIKDSGLNWKQYFYSTYSIEDINFLIETKIKQVINKELNKEDALLFIQNNKGLSERQAYRLYNDILKQ